MAAKIFFLQIQHQSKVYQIFVHNYFGLLLHVSLFTEKKKILMFNITTPPCGHPF